MLDGEATALHATTTQGLMPLVFIPPLSLKAHHVYEIAVADGVVMCYDHDDDTLAVTGTA